MERAQKKNEDKNNIANKIWDTKSNTKIIMEIERDGQRKLFNQRKAEK